MRPLWQVIEANVRDPYATLGDLAAQISALRRGEQRLLELADRYGVDTLCAGIEGLLEQTSERARAEFASWPRTAVEAVGYMDDDGVIRDVPLTIAVRLWTTADGELHVDLAGSAAQSPGGINVPWASSHAAVYFGVRAFCGSAVPQNDGLTRHVHLHCEEGEPAAAAVPGRRVDAPHRGAAPHRRGRRGARRPAARTARSPRPTCRSRPSSSRRPTRATAASRS